MVWAIYQLLFYKTSEEYRDDLKTINETKWEDHFFKIVMFSERVALMFTIIMWYVGMMLGCFVAGWFLIRIVQKKNIYVSFSHIHLSDLIDNYILAIEVTMLSNYPYHIFQYVAALVMFASGCVFYSADVDESSWQLLLLVGRLLAGIGHGITYVTIFVQASENASKDFRRIIGTLIGITIGLSIFIASSFLIYIPVPTVQKIIGVDNVAEMSETMSSGIISTATIFLSFVSVIINFFFSHETVPFLLYHNYREEEAQSAMARFLGEDQHAPIVQQEFDAMRELCHHDYAEFPEGNIFTTIHRRLISIALSARITSAQCLNMLCIIMFVKLIESMISEEYSKILKENTNNMTESELFEQIDKLLQLSYAYSIAVRTAIATWFILGLMFTLIGNYFNWKRGLHFTTFLVGAAMLICPIFHWIGIFSDFFKAIAFLFITVYVHFLSLPVDVLNYSYLMECFPTSTKAKAIAFTTIFECIFNAIFISIEIQHKKLGIEFFSMGLLFCVLGFKLYALVPNTNGLSLAAAKHAYLQALSTNWWEFYKNK